MLNVPMLKLDKNNTYISSQLEQQENNKQLILNIIENVNLILNNSSTKELNTYKSILDSATNYLSTISGNIVTLEKLNIEIIAISKELENLQDSKNKQSKENLIHAFSNVKNNIAEYTAKLKKTQEKIDNDNNKFNEFINVNNVKYNFVVNDEGTDYKFTGFCIDNNSNEETPINNVTENTYEKVDNCLSEDTKTIPEIADNDAQEIYDTKSNNLEEYIIDNTKSLIEEDKNAYETKENTQTNEKIDKLTNNFRKMLINLSNGDVNIEKPEYLMSYFQEINNLSSNFSNDTVNYDIDKAITETTEKLANNDIEETDFVPVKFTKDLENDDVIKPFETVNLETPVDLEQSVKSTEVESTTDFGYDFGKTFGTPFVKNNKNIPLTDNNFQNKNVVTDSVDEIAIQEELINTKLKKIITATADNETLIISEKTNKIYLPYKISELINYIDNYPNVYSSLSDVVQQEFILPFDYFMKHPYKSRFFETYNLIRNRQGRSPMYAVINALKYMNKSNLNPAIIASCKTEEEFNTYIYYLDANRLEEFKGFNIIYLVNPL